MLTKGQKNLWLLTADNSNGNFDPPLQKEDSGTCGRQCSTSLKLLNSTQRGAISDLSPLTGRFDGLGDSNLKSNAALCTK